MTQIDHAFIQAYTTSERPPAALEGEAQTAPNPPIALPRASPIPAPHVRVHPVPAEPGGVTTVAMAPEPIPAPHFQDAPRLDPLADQESADQATLLRVATPGEASARPPMGDAQRRPLSTFAAAEQGATTAFDPVFEVDAFRWPAIVDELIGQHQRLLAPVVEQLLEAREAGRTMVGVAGTRPQVGCTTVHLCLARLLTQAGLQVVLVDGNFAQGDLASQLGLEFDTGWEDVLGGRVPLAESVIKSLSDGLALLPLSGACHGAGELLSGIQTSITAGVLRYHYDMVLFDLGAAGQLPQYRTAEKLLEHCRLDVSLVVADFAADSAAGTGMTAESIDQLLTLLGATCHGLIGNQAA